MLRSTSYRKPVPIYVPSPPPSPCHPTAEQDVDEEEKLPPLPANWREVLDKISITLPAKPEPISTVPSQVQALDYSKVGQHIMDKAELTSSPMLVPPKRVNIGGDGSTESLSILPRSGSQSSSYLQRQRRLHQYYRPPTPPIPSQNKRLPSIPGAKIEENFTIRSNAEVSLSQGRHQPMNKFGLHHEYPRGHPGGASSLKISPSFRTEKTMVSLNTNPSTGWSHGMTTFTDAGLYSCPTLLMHEQNRDTVKIAGDMSDSATCWEGVEIWGKKLRSLMIFCK
ncbi:hypothetical protein B0H34DRAFT_793689 [Crassisporium funariophilum]|nr:hypothetical protein B0H34DRAFT_793689 [Crassisporium funariophilum]